MKVQYLALIGCAIALSLVSGVTQSSLTAQANPCGPNPCAPLNPCAAKSANPCAANPCAAKTANPCAASASEPVETADVKAVANPCASYKLAVEVVDGKNIVNLTQTPCQFLESEGVNLNFQSNSAEDCKQINQTTADSRTAQPLTLPAGDYVFRVTNESVPYEVGFYLRGAGLGGVTLPRVSGGGLTEGMTKDYVVSLRPGEYVYSCPLNPTLNYPLVVTAS